METYKFVPVLIVYTAILLLVIFYVVPFLKKLCKRKISISIHFSAEEKEEEEPVVEPEKQEVFPSVLGKSKFVLRQPLHNATTDLETENRKKKEDTFACGTEKPEDKNINYETGEGVEVPPENEGVADVDLNDESEDLGAEKGIPDAASGTDYNELGVAAEAVSNPRGSTPADEYVAGKVLSENKLTQLVKSMQDARPEYAKRVTELIDRYDQKLSEAQNQKVKTSRKKQKLYESDDFKSFNINEIS